MFEGIEVRISRLAVYRNDGTGRLRLARHCVRYSYENQNLCRDPALRPHATQHCVGARPEAGDRLQPIIAKAARVRDRMRRLQSFPQYRCDPEMHMWVRLYRQVEDLLAHMVRPRVDRS